MAYWGLTWNPEQWPMSSFIEERDNWQADPSVEMRWSTGNTKRIVRGDTVFLIRQGSEPRGVVGYGVVDSEEVFEDEHWRGESPRAGRKALYARVRWRALDTNPLIPLRTDPPFDRVRWGHQQSGFTIPEDAAMAILGLLIAEIDSATAFHADEMPDEPPFEEGGRVRVYVDRHERNPKARAACLAHHGSRCLACDRGANEVYGDAVVGLIEVHHLAPLGKEPERHQVNPVTDLVPLCPNCHAVAHFGQGRDGRPRSVNEIRRMLDERQHGSILRR